MKEKPEMIKSWLRLINNVIDYVEKVFSSEQIMKMGF